MAENLAPANLFPHRLGDGCDFDQQLYLEITVDVSGPNGTNDNAITAADPPMLPRQAILPVVFAKEAADSRKLSGYGWTAVFSEGASNPATARVDGNRIVAQSVTATQIAPQTITAAQIASNTITSGQLAASIVGAAQLASNSINAFHLSAALIQDAIHPPGTVISWMGTNTVPPAGWEFCWGQTVSRTDPKYARLFGVIGTSSGNGNGSTTFGLPDLRAMFLRGVNVGRSDPYTDPDFTTRVSFFGGNSGNQVGSVQPRAFDAHAHGTAINTPNNNGGVGAYGSGSKNVPFPSFLMWGAQAGGNHPAQNSELIGGTETRPNNVYVHYLIKL